MNAAVCFEIETNRKVTAIFDSFVLTITGVQGRLLTV